MEEKRRIEYIDVARVIAIISITFNHAVNRSFSIDSGQFKEFNSIPLIETIFKTILYCFSRIGVPLFLMISGALLIPRDYSGDNAKRFINKNWKQLLITTEIWLIIMFWYKQLAPTSVLHTEGISKCILRFISTLLFVNQDTMSSMWYMPMILCVYLLIPIISLAIKRIDNRFLILPIIIVTFYSYILPDINGTLHALGSNINLESELNSSNVFSMFLVVVIAGYYVSRGMLSNVNTKVLVFLLSFSFFLFCIFQFWFYSVEYDYVVGKGYRSLFPVIVALFMFELLSRIKKNYPFWIKKVITNLSSISFGIYFLHICIMEGLLIVFERLSWNPPNMILFFLLELISFVGSVIIILILKHNSWIGKNLFGIKSN